MKVEGDTEIVTLARAPRDDALDEEPETPAAKGAAKPAKAETKDSKAEKGAKNAKVEKGANAEEPADDSGLIDDGDQLSLL